MVAVYQYGGTRLPDSSLDARVGKNASGLSSEGLATVSVPPYSRIRRRRRALETTVMELMLMAAPANIGLRSQPKNG